MYKNNVIKGKKYKKQFNKILNEIKFIGVTGTNGKTTTTTLLYKYYRFKNENVTLIGTNGVYINDDFFESINTTPGIDELYNIIKISYDKGVRIIIMEVSSHAIVQKRIFGIKFYIKALTNITRDHLDYHKSFKNYKHTKLKFLKNANIIINDSIKFNKVFRKIYKFGVNNKDFKINNILIKEDGILFNLKINKVNYSFSSNLLGEFNCYNVSLFISILYLLNDFDYKKISEYLKDNIQIPGRMECFNYRNKRIIVDYAHTPDGFKQVLNFVKKIYKNKILTIFGCGGNRDKYKREIMGKIACIYSDYIILTTDNPRDEDPQLIINDIIRGMINNNYLVEVDRKKAIDMGLKMINDFNVILVLGRGNEKYNTIKNNKILFNDIDYIKEKIYE